jgi:NitT/TauT family transport system substrate-binding protein
MREKSHIIPSAGSDRDATGTAAISGGTMRRIWLVGLLALINTAPSSAQKITIGHMPVTNQSEVVTQQLGLYKKHGLDVELKLFPTGPAALQGLLSGDLQMVEAGGAPMLNLAAQNLPLYFLATGGINTPDHPAGAIMIRQDDTSIKSFADLKGKKLGGLPKGTITHLWVANALARYGMKRSDFQEVFLPFPQMGGLLASKQVDAIYSWPPFITMTEQAGQGKVLVNDAEWNPYAVLNAMIVHRNWADQNPQLVRGLLKASMETQRWINDHVDEARAIFGQQLKLPATIATNMRMFYFPRNGYQLMPSIWDFYYLMVNTGELQPMSDPKQVIQSYWIEPAEKFITPALTEIGKQDDPVVRNVLKIKLPNLPGDLADYLGPWER